MKNNKGFTFLEMMIAFSIFSILILVIYSTFFNEIKKSTQNDLLITMNLEGNRSINHLQEVIDHYDNIDVVSNTLITSSGVPIIDARNDGGSLGTEINLDFNTQKLIDKDTQILGNNIKSIRFEKGPYRDSMIGITKDMLLIVIEFEQGLVTYTIKGGVNLVR